MYNPSARHILAQILRFGAHVPTKYAALRCSNLNQTALELVNCSSQEIAS